MRDFQIFLVDKIHKYGFYLSSFCWVFTLGFTLLNYSNLAPVIPLFYNRPWGASQLAPTWWLFAVVSAVGMVLFGNLLLAMYVSKRHLLLSRIVIWISVLLVLLVSITTIRIIVLIS